jgi:hypothetical protein
MSAKPTQQQRILAVLQSLQSGDHHIPDEYLRRHKSGDGISARYFKQALLVSECNGRISELRSKGYDIETSKQKDKFGFAYHRLKPEGAVLSSIRAAAEKCRLFDAGAPAGHIFASQTS